MPTTLQFQHTPQTIRMLRPPIASKALNEPLPALAFCIHFSLAASIPLVFQAFRDELLALERHRLAVAVPHRLRDELNNTTHLLIHSYGLRCQQSYWHHGAMQNTGYAVKAEQYEKMHVINQHVANVRSIAAP